MGFLSQWDRYPQATKMRKNSFVMKNFTDARFLVTLQIQID